LALLRPESLSGMCAKLRIVAASNNRDHASQSLLLLFARATHIYCFSSRTSRCGESHNQHNATREVATAPPVTATSPLSSYCTPLVTYKSYVEKRNNCWMDAWMVLASDCDVM